MPKLLRELASLPVQLRFQCELIVEKAGRKLMKRTALRSIRVR